MKCHIDLYGVLFGQVFHKALCWCSSCFPYLNEVSNDTDCNMFLVILYFWSLFLMEQPRCHKLCMQSILLGIIATLFVCLAAGTQKVSAAYADIVHPGDLSSLSWRQLHTLPQSPADHTVCITTNTASINFRDVMLATGRLSTQAIPGNNRNKNNISS